VVRTGREPAAPPAPQSPSRKGRDRGQATALASLAPSKDVERAAIILFLLGTPPRSAPLQLRHSAAAFVGDPPRQVRPRCSSASAPRASVSAAQKKFCRAVSPRGFPPAPHRGIPAVIRGGNHAAPTRPRPPSEYSGQGQEQHQEQTPRGSAPNPAGGFPPPSPRAVSQQLELHQQHRPLRCRGSAMTEKNPPPPPSPASPTRGA